MDKGNKIWLKVKQVNINSNKFKANKEINKIVLEKGNLLYLIFQNKDLNQFLIRIKMKNKHSTNKFK